MTHSDSSATSGNDRTPLQWRFSIIAGIVALTGIAYLLRDTIGPRGQSFVGVFCFFGLVAAFSANLRAVRWSTIGWGIVLQLVLAVLVLRVPFVKAGFEQAKEVVVSFIGFSDKGAEFVFGNLARPGDIALNPGKEFMFMFAFKVLPPILFVSAFFTVLYHYGILQRIVRLMARVMVHLMGTSGAETLSVSANVFMGQTEAPLIVKPYVPRMTNSELFALMTSGFAHISGAMMVVYISYGADPVAVLTTCIMACPGSLYLAKLFMPETSTPETAGTLHSANDKSPFVNGIDAAASGTTDGLKLALNVAAMLIVFIAFVAMFDALLGYLKPGLAHLHIYLGAWADDLSLAKVFGWLFSPVAFLMGVESGDISKVGTLLGAKLSINEHYAYLVMKSWKAQEHFMTDRSYKLAAFALTGFANFASVGIQLGGIGAIAPERRHDLAKLGLRALFVGFVATLLNAAIAGIFL
jgi:CNT family concentrative nucleoside transporter